MPFQDRNQASIKISSEVKVRRSARLLGKAKVMSFDNETQAKGAVKEAIKGRGKRGRKRMCAALEASEPELEPEPEPEPEPEMTAPMARMI
ncbi:hypothetical protein V490_07553 [Pseudogymnoascus sp. VKM F-3557]|nr:hypothetical protein V490_07553 [Pseudogymnoascus sp. VKM F-3557]